MTRPSPKSKNQVRTVRSLVLSVAPYSIAGAVGIILVKALLPSLILWVGKCLIDSIAAADGPFLNSDTLSYFGLECGLVVLQLVTQLVYDHHLLRLSQKVDFKLREAISRKSFLADFCNFEIPDYYDGLKQVTQEGPERCAQLIRRSLRLLEISLMILSIAVLIATLNPWVIVVLFLSVLPGFGLSFHIFSERFNLFTEETRDRRQSDYLQSLLTTEASAKEVRLFGYGPYILERILKMETSFLKRALLLSKRISIYTFAGEFLAMLCYFSAYVYILQQTYSGILSLGALTLCIASFSRIQSTFESLLESVAELGETLRYARLVEEFLAKDSTIESLDVLSTLPLALPQALHFKDVTFTYPGALSPALQNICLTIQPGEFVAIVGLNGSGKSTLAKLLLRLYDPDSGTINFGSQNLKDINIWDWRRRLSAVFQDFVRYQLSLLDNLRLSAPLIDFSQAGLKNVLFRARLTDLVDQLPDGLDTRLGKKFEEGADLSIGQWQRIAIARAYTRDADLVILDEPTSALDPEVENEILENFRDLRRGRTTVLITHNLAATQEANRIFVLAGGQIVESGSYLELMKKNSLFARLYGLQASKFIQQPMKKDLG